MRGVLFPAAALFLLSTAACAAATPTTDPAMIQASAVSAANTMVAMTQAAVPTATDMPPSPFPSPTLLPSPTLSALPTLSLGTLPPPISAASTGDRCQGPMAPKPNGPLKSVRILNNTGGSVVLSLFLQKTAFGECGYRGFNLVPHGSVIATNLPEGCYSGGAFVTAPKAKTKAFGSGCLTGPGVGLVTIESNGETISVGN